eukprot:GFYU01014622.1.p1 GENE.GFYU01014622.1~~GFYU01014622.1.p1  ORF type:complete len:218 (+),score=35.37 GFYU01014622.1:162-815(+)
MGVRRVFQSKSSNPAKLQEVEERCEALLAKKAGKWAVTVRLLHNKIAIGKEKNPNDPNLSDWPRAPPRDLYQFAFSEAGDASYLLLPDKDRPLFLETGKDISLILDKSKMYIQRQECLIQGVEYELGDIIVRLGTAVIGSSAKGQVVEIEYCPCMHEDMALPILHEVTELLHLKEDHFVPVVVDWNPWKHTSLPHNWTLRHSSIQYLSLFDSYVGTA